MRFSKSTLSTHRSALLAARASGMRRAPTASEAALFELVRGRRLGVPFRRQVVLAGRYIADLFAPTIGLVVEIDGGYHAQKRRADARRDRVLERAGLHVLRLDAHVVLRQPERVLALLRAEVARLART